MAWGLGVTQARGLFLSKRFKQWPCSAPHRPAKAKQGLGSRGKGQARDREAKATPGEAGQSADTQRPSAALRSIAKATRS